MPGGRRGSPPALRRGPSGLASAGRGHGQRRAGGWGRPPWSPPRGGGGFVDGPHGWGGLPLRLDAPGGGGVFARMTPAGYHPGDHHHHHHHQQPQQHFQHDLRWEEPRYEAPPGAGTQQQQPQQHDLRLGLRHRSGSWKVPALPYQQEQEQAQQAQQQQQQAQQQEVAPWERPSYMDLELQRRQQQQAQQAAQQQQQYAQRAQTSPPPEQQQQVREETPNISSIVVASPRAGGSGSANRAAGVFARALSQAAASLQLSGRSLSAAPPAAQRFGHPGGHQHASFQITITHPDGGPSPAAHGGPGAARAVALAAPLLSQPDLQEVLRRRLRDMELQLVKLRAEQEERAAADARRGQELSAAAKLE